MRGRGANAAGDWRQAKKTKEQEQNKENEAEEDMDEVIRKMQSKYTSAAGISTSGADSRETQTPSKQDAVVDKDPEDLNELAALAMQAMLSGDMDRYEEYEKRLAAKRGQQEEEKQKAEVERQQHLKALMPVKGGGKGGKQRLQHNLEHCFKCMESRKFRFRETVLSSSNHAYVSVDTFKDSILPGQVFICPQEHMPAVTDLEDSEYAEMRNYQKCLVRFFEAQEPPKAVIFAESAIHRVSKEKLLLGAGPHTSVVAYPIDSQILSQARTFFKKAFDEAECEWSAQHKKVIETTAKGGVRAAIPKHFPYVHIDFSLGGGYAHVVEEAEEFSQQFAQQTIAGMCELTVLDRAYSTKDEHAEAVRSMKEKFKEFDWTKSVQ
jgi:hypothetical protein